MIKDIGDLAWLSLCFSVVTISIRQQYEQSVTVSSSTKRKKSEIAEVFFVLGFLTGLGFFGLDFLAGLRFLTGLGFLTRLGFFGLGFLTGLGFCGLGFCGLGFLTGLGFVGFGF